MGAVNPVCLTLSLSKNKQHFILLLLLQMFLTFALMSPIGELPAHHCKRARKMLF